MAVAMANNINSDDASDNKNNYQYLIKTIQVVKIIDYVSIQLTYINFIQLYLTNFFFNEKKALNNLFHSVAILMAVTHGRHRRIKARGQK